MAGEIDFLIRAVEEDTLSEAVKQLVEQGHSQVQIYLWLEAVRSSFWECEANEDCILDVMDYVWGSCSPHLRLFPDNLSSEEIAAFRADEKSVSSRSCKCMKPTLSIHSSATILVEKVAERIIEIASQSIEAKGHFSLALSGGSTPKALYQRLASPECRDRIDWSKVHVFFGDERAVAPDDALSNYRMAREAMLDHVSIPSANVHRLRGESENLEEEAARYEWELQQFAPLALALLGMGDDGHTASIFPHSPVVNETEKLCAATPVATLEPHVRRLTLTFPAINSASRVWALITGAGKTARLEQVEAAQESGQLNIGEMPILGVQPQGEYIWWLDHAAAGEKE